MHKHINIEYQYDRIVLDFSQMKLKDPMPVSAIRWAALEKAEQRLYHSDGPGMMGWTDVNTPDVNPEFIEGLWSHAWDHLECTQEGWDGYSSQSKHVLVAGRVAKALALLAFGPEALLK